MVASTDPERSPERPGERDSVSARLADLFGEREAAQLALVGGIARRFPGKAAGLVAGAVEAARAGDAAEAARLVHTLKGSALNLGAVGLPVLCQDVEDLAREGRCAEVVDSREALERAVADFAGLLAEELVR